jgi:hypothetical protein
MCLLLKKKYLSLVKELLLELLVAVLPKGNCLKHQHLSRLPKKELHQSVLPCGNISRLPMTKM